MWLFSVGWAGPVDTVDTVDAAGAVIAAADPWLRAMLVPGLPVPGEDFRGEAVAPDLYRAQVELRGTVLTGTVEAEEIGAGGVWISVDTRGGPAPDLRVWVGEGAVRVAPVDGWEAGEAVPYRGRAVRTGDHIAFSVDLAGSGRVEPGRVGAAAAEVSAGGVIDSGPAGATGLAPAYAREVLEAMAAREDLSGDADLAVAVAVDFAIWYAWVEPELRAQVVADALGWYRYGRDLDRWLEAQGLPWRLGSQPAAAKLLWAWPGGQSMIYGALPLAWEADRLGEERYRYHMVSADLLAQLRDGMPLVKEPGRELWATADARDAWIWDRLSYRGPPGAMERYCRDGTFSAEDCRRIRAEQSQNWSPGSVGGAEIPPDAAVSAPFQWAFYQREGRFIGDCATATSLSMAAWQSIGLVPLALGYGGASFDWPTHEQPFVLMSDPDGDRFFSPQSPPPPAFARERTYVYAVLPAVHPLHGLTLGWEPQGWARGGAVPGGWLLYGQLSRRMEDGIPLGTVAGWLEEQVRGGWGQIR